MILKSFPNYISDALLYLVVSEEERHMRKVNLNKISYNFFLTLIYYTIINYVKYN